MGGARKSLDSGSVWKVDPAYRRELEGSGVVTGEQLVRWLADTKFAQACPCCGVVGKTVLSEHNGICGRCRGHVVCKWCASKFVPGGESAGLLCADALCRSEFESFRNEYARGRPRKGDKEAITKQLFFRTCPLEGT